MKDREPKGSSINQRLLRISSFWMRWAAILLVLIYIPIHFDVLAARGMWLLVIALAAAIFNIALLLASQETWARLQQRGLILVGDLIFTACLVALGGGRGSIFFWLFLLPVFWSALSHGRAMAASVAGFALLSYILILIAGGQWDWHQKNLYDLLFRATALLLTAFGAGIISDQQRQLLNRHREISRLAEDWSRAASDIQSAAMYGLGALLSSSRSIEETLSLTLDAVEDILKADRCSILLLDKKSNELVLRAARGMRAGAVGKLRLKSDQGLAGEALRSGKPINVPDTDLDSRFVPSPSGYEKIRSMLVVPLMVRDVRLGVINISSVKKKRMFTEKEMMAIKLVADYVALALENAGLLEEKEREATTDGLTGLYNYRYFKNRLTELADQYRNRTDKLSLIWMDLDHFKEYNDSFGHIKGSDVLKKLAQIISESLDNRKAVVARYGGDEFAIILPDAGRREGLRIAEEIRRNIFQTDFAPDGKGYQKISASLGLAVLPDDAQDSISLIEKADQAMYFAKERGKNRVGYWRGQKIEIRKRK